MSTVTEGDIFMCIFSASNFYLKGKLYEVKVGKKGTLVLVGEDGIEDELNTLKSRFKKVDPMVKLSVVPK